MKTDKQQADTTVPVDPREWKIFPRNLTARADYIVPGNPCTTRPEDAVDNCYPGLEMDARNIQKFFFPGLYFEVYRENGARLVELTPVFLAKQWIDLGLQEQDLSNDIYLWALQGRKKAQESKENPPVVSFVNEDGLYAWRMANALFPGKTAIVFGPKPAEENTNLQAALESLKSSWNTDKSIIQRAKNGELEWAVLVAERAGYLNEQGVLDPDVYKPGDFTRTLCTPWTFDFRDCQCFYWASNKPDTASSEDGKYKYLNFQRKNRAVEPQTQDIAYGYEARRLNEIDYAEMMIDWQQLYPVLNGREFGETYKPAIPPVGPLLTFAQIKQEVSYLATVEHALAVQYLYAYYSVNSPSTLPDNPTDKEQLIYQSTQEIFNIAVDEMRHFRWANEILKLLGTDTTAKRATMLGRNFRVPFYMQSLSSQQLQWFVDVERPSRSTLHGLDGMYVGVLRSLQKLTDSELDPGKKRRAIEIAKLIIDEGEGHYQRFSVVQQNLAFYDDSGRGALPSYIRSQTWSAPSQPGPGVPYQTLYGAPFKAPPDTPSENYQKQSNKLYQSLLMLLKIAFAMQTEKLSGEALRQAITLMFAMNAVNFSLAEHAGTPLFTLPPNWDQDPPIRTRENAKAMMRRIRQLLTPESTHDTAMATLLKAKPADKGPHDKNIEEVLEFFDVAIDSSRFIE